MFLPHVAALHLRQMLQQAYYQTGDCKPTQTTCVDFIQSSYEQKVLYQDNQWSHGREISVPATERINSNDTCEVFKGQINLEPSKTVHILDDWNLGIPDDLDRIRLGETLISQMFGKFVHEATTGAKSWIPAPSIFVRDYHKIHIRCRQIQTRSKGAERFNSNSRMAFRHARFQA